MMSVKSKQKNNSKQFYMEKKRNLWVIPTESFNPIGQQIWRRKNGGLFKPTKSNPIANNLEGKINIYITSDETAYPYALHYQKEVLKIRAVGENSRELYHDKGFSYPDQCKKIILTTDQDLINDSVQAIDDEFLEWFVKNPSCESVEVSKVNKIGLQSIDVLDKKHDLSKGIYNAIIKDANKLIYKIIIPKEEFKITNCGNKNCQSGVINGVNPKICRKCNPKEESKKETLERAAERLYSNDGYFDELYCDIGEYNKEKFIEGAKWNQERSYSEEEVIDLLRARNIELGYYGGSDEIEEWFEQFKKK